MSAPNGSSRSEGRSATPALKPLAQAVPFLLVWGERDSIIPVEHARAGVST